MGCDYNILYNAACCDTSPATELETMSSDYFDCLKSRIWELVKKMYADEMFGKSEDSNTYANMINDFMYLYAYFVIIYYQRIEDASNDLVCHNDKGIPYYLTEFKIDCIKKYFVCKNMDISSLLNAFDLGQVGTNDGINFMAIEEAYPDTCTTNNELFIVEKPI